MPSLVGQVQYVNPPKSEKGPGSIKLHDGRYMKVWREKLADFEAGRAYNIEYTEDQYRGETQMTVVKSTPAEYPSQNGRAATGGPKSTQFVRPETPGSDAERMFVCSLMNAFIQAGQINANEQEIISNIKMLRSAWVQTFGNPQKNERVGDEIPY